MWSHNKTPAQSFPQGLITIEYNRLVYSNYLRILEVPFASYLYRIQTSLFSDLHNGCGLLRGGSQKNINVPFVGDAPNEYAIGASSL